ncbi:PAS modulated sigma54 specific transcriptional regulator, Fis family [Desulfovibrio sp. X2]|uniref:sigma-54-dependent Fis family transcriptional regulator n=1 Tax=Desulfovibrio sp. X2 TaxID=941449 RepID=UPI000358B1E4|nr:sigma-54-dependent Fis family transcriptional regulator [Desulfovibrio sp. X2]EPR37499.1 PAS modulated sigma54 specific transcriptional regulator, Fis family [Desulfovibrio sp. X2]
MAEYSKASDEALYREIVEGQSEPVCRFLPDGSLTFANQAFSRLFGAGEPLPQSFFELAPVSDRSRIRLSLSGLTGKAPTGSLEQRVLDSGGRTRWLQWNVRALFGEDGAVAEYQAVGRDITTRRVAEEALLQVTSEKESLRLNLEAVFQSIPDGILTVDQDFHIVRTNKAARNMLGGGEPLEPGRSLAEGQESWRLALMEVVRQTLRSREGVSEFRIDCLQDDLPRVLVANSSPLLDHQGTFSGAVVVVRDITRLDDLERKLSERHRFQNIIGKSPQMQAVYGLLEQLAAVDTTVLVLGESGTGKELVVDALHYGGPRAKGPLVKVNCSALSESLLESELFGHVKGAFTGAVSDKAGRFQAAEGGTIFLDEIGDISPRIQLKLLRGLERKEFERVGDNRTYRADVRVVAATNVDLLDKVRQGQFREDLYYRLKVVVVRLPPLRERKEDVPLLADHFLRHFAKSFGKSLDGLDEAALALFMRYPWPGNVRELKHSLEHAALLSRGSRVVVDDLPQELADFAHGTNQPRALFGTAGDAAAVSGEGARRPADLGRADFLDALARTDWNKAKAARLLGISRRTLYRKLDELRIVSR